MLLLMIEQGLPINTVLWADTGMEFPEMYDHIRKVDDYLYRERGIHITTLRHPKGFEYLMFEEKSKSHLPSKTGKGWAFRFAETAGPALRSDGVPGSLKRILSARRSTGSRGSIRHSTMSASRQMSRSGSKMSNIRWWTGVSPKQRLCKYVTTVVMIGADYMRSTTAVPVGAVPSSGSTN